ncbi:MAG: acetolactate synthase small subunit [Actinomycetota bacterium]
MRTTHILSVLVENRPGVLARIAGLFARRGFNIDSLAVGEAESPALSRMTIVVSVEDKPLEQITKQLHKLINVLRITELAHEEAVERELVLFKVGVGAGRRAEVLEVAEIFRAKVVDVDADALVLEATGTPEKMLALENLLRPYGLVEVARTGRVALARGGRGLAAPALTPVPLAR